MGYEAFHSSCTGYTKYSDIVNTNIFLAKYASTSNEILLKKIITIKKYSDDIF